jgi:hypothetical protein
LKRRRGRIADVSRLKWDLIGFKKRRWCEGVVFMLWIVELNLHLQCMIIGEIWKNKEDYRLNCTENVYHFRFLSIFNSFKCGEM